MSPAAQARVGSPQPPLSVWSLSVPGACLRGAPGSCWHLRQSPSPVESLPPLGATSRLFPGLLLAFPGRPSLLPCAAVLLQAYLLLGMSPPRPLECCPSPPGHPTRFLSLTWWTRPLFPRTPAALTCFICFARWSPGAWGEPHVHGEGFLHGEPVNLGLVHSFPHSATASRLALPQRAGTGFPQPPVSPAG